MWKSVGSPHRACVFVTSTGTPRAAHTLLKFTPAAMTITSASFGPSVGHVDDLVADRVARLPEAVGSHQLRMHPSRHLADGRDLADLEQVFRHGCPSDGMGRNPSNRRRPRAHP